MNICLRRFAVIILVFFSMTMIYANNTPVLDSPAHIRGWITQIKERLEKDNDQLPALIQEVENAIPSVSDPATEAVLHSMLAEMYQRFYQQYGWQIRQRTPLAGYIPGDIREWTSNLFEEKIKQELTASLQPAALLQSTAAISFREIMEPGSDSPALRPTLYDFLAWRGLDIQPSEEIYDALLTFRRTQSNERAYVVAYIAYLQYTYPGSKEQTQQLDSLLQVYKGQPVSVEIVNAKLNQLDILRFQTQNTDSVKAIAYQLAQETVREFPDDSQINLIKNRIVEWENPTIRMNLPSSVYPEHAFDVDIFYRNTSKIEIALYKSELTPLEVLTQTENNSRSNREGKVPVYKEEKLLPVENLWKEEKTTFRLQGLEAGIYELVMSVSGEEMEMSRIVNVTSFATVHCTINGRGTEIYVTDLQSGKPLPGVTIRYYEGNRNNMKVAGTVLSDIQGVAQLPGRPDITGYDIPEQANGRALITSIYNRWYTDPDIQAGTQVSFFTDRMLFRPGQNLFFKGIVYVNDPEQPRIVAGRTYRVGLYDANNQEIAFRELKSNEFGSFEGEFSLPLNGVTGMYSLRTAEGQLYFRVEEYKRPTFRVEVNPIKEDIALGDTVWIRGVAQTYSGVPLTEGELAYRIIKQDRFLRDYLPGSEQVAAGNIQLEPDGTFRIPFRAGTEEEANGRGFYQYQVQISVTDSKGESQETTYSFAVGGNSLVLFVENYAGRAEKENVDLTVKAQTINGEPVSVPGRFSVYQLLQNGVSEEWTEGKLLINGVFETGVSLKKEIFTGLPSGMVRIRLETTDSKGRKTELQHDLLLYSKKDIEPPVYSPIWYLLSGESYIPGEKVDIVIGSSMEDAYMLYEVLNGKDVVKREILRLQGKNRNLQFIFQEDWKEGVLLSFTLVKEGKLYKETTSVYRKYPDRTLNFHPITFRDKLRPGQAEQWRFRITGPDGTPANAEVLAAMYDMSLDQIYSSFFNFSLNRYPFIPVIQFTEGEDLREQGRSISKQYTPLPVNERIYDRLDWQGTGWFTAVQVRGYSSMRMSAEAVVPDMVVADAGMMKSGKAVAVNAPANQAQSGGGNTEPLVAVADIRTNFNETAFFYPTLLTDKEGNFYIQFTIPESNTTWRLQMVAHTKDLKYGVYSQQVITQRPLMVIPNLPRFVRKGDRVTFSTQIINQTGAVLAGQVLLELFNPVTGEVLNTTVVSPQKEIQLQKDGTGTVNWQWDVPYTEELVGVRIIATSPEGSDGEQHVLPVVNDEILITESNPFYLGEKNTGRVEIPSGIFQVGNRPFSLTFEATANPIWYAVQALPAISNPVSDNVIDWFNAYYSNVVAGALLQTTPRLQEVVTAWSKQGGNAETFLSELEKNEELKQILLAETPWVLQAKDRMEQLQQLVLLFDVNRSAAQKEKAFRKLQEQQLESGAWGWFKGLYPNRQMTVYILRGMAQLTNLNAIEYNQQEKEMQIKALAWLDKAIKEDYDRLLKDGKELKNYVPDGLQIEYLLMRSAYRDIPEAGESREAIRYYTNQAAKLWEKLSLESKAATALLMYRNGDAKTAGRIVDWFRKTATVSDELGLYWANNRPGTANFNTPVGVHCVITDMFREISPRTEEIDRMKQWLLNQKRTQQWETAPATMNAIYILLKTGSGWLDEGNRLEIVWADRKVSSEQGGLVTGYIKETVPAEDIRPVSFAEISREGTQPAWGAVYAQYFSKLENVEATTGVLNVAKKLFIERNNGEQRRIEPVTTNRTLQVGDKVIVRLTIRTDREMSYVYLHDMRPGFMEPANQISGTQYRDGIAYYSTPRDLSENFFIERLPAGTFVLEYSGYVSRTGGYSGGVATIQCLYASEYISHTASERIEVKPPNPLKGGL